MIDLDGVVRSWNSGAMRLKGYSADEIIGKSFSVFYTPEDRANGLPQRALQIARETGLSRESLYRALGDGGNPELSTMTKVMRALGLRIQVAPAKPAKRRRAAA